MLNDKEKGIKDYFDAARMINAVLTQIPAAEIQRYIQQAASCSETLDEQTTLLQSAQKPLEWVDCAQLAVATHVSFTNFFQHSHDIFDNARRAQGSL
jgi:hypothetical protein